MTAPPGPRGLLTGLACVLFGHRPVTAAIFLVDPPWREVVCLRCRARWTDTTPAESTPAAGNAHGGG